MDDVDRVVELLNARSRRIYGRDQTTRDNLRPRWGRSGFSLEADARLVLDGDGAAAGLVYVDDDGPPHASIGCVVSMHPRCENDFALCDRLCARGLARASEFVTLAARGIRVDPVPPSAKG
jgi:hypothetical protein